MVMSVAVLALIGCSSKDSGIKTTAAPTTPSGATTSGATTSGQPSSAATTALPTMAAPPNIWADTRKHYSHMAEDEFDFASYCLRILTLRAYADFLRLEDRIKGHWFFGRMCCGLIPLLLRDAKGEVTENSITPSKNNRKKN